MSTREISLIISSNNTYWKYLQECSLLNIYNNQDEAINLLRVSVNRNVSIEQMQNNAIVFLQLNVFLLQLKSWDNQTVSLLNF